jgi:DNA-binding GntR family transcriptional regulator
LHWLQREGYIISTSSNNSKARLTIAPLTKEDARELYWIIGHVEGLAARTTAQLDSLTRIEVIEKLKKINKDLSGLAENLQRDPNRIFDLDMSFHQTVVDASAGPRLRALHNSIKPQTERYWRLYASSIIDQLSASVGEHARVVEGIERGDPEVAERAIQTNWQNGADRLCKVIDTFGERGSW